jgi:uncharacterized DUF497 family protein
MFCLFMSEAIFEWDGGKNLENIRKHGVSFSQAQDVFFDKNRIVAEDLGHSQHENRYYCFGLNREQSGILTVRFTYRSGSIRIIGAGYWRKGKKSMNKKIQYSDEDIGDVRIVTDFLPSPAELALKERLTKITISLSSDSVTYFKKTAREHDMQYQKMIRQLLDDMLHINRGERINAAVF